MTQAQTEKSARSAPRLGPADSLPQRIPPAPPLDAFGDIRRGLVDRCPWVRRGGHAANLPQRIVGGHDEGACRWCDSARDVWDICVRFLADSGSSGSSHLDSWCSSQARLCLLFRCLLLALIADGPSSSSSSPCSFSSSPCSFLFFASQPFSPPCRCHCCFLSSFDFLGRARFRRESPEVACLQGTARTQLVQPGGFTRHSNSADTAPSVAKVGDTSSGVAEPIVACRTGAGRELAKARPTLRPTPRCVHSFRTGQDSSDVARRSGELRTSRDLGLDPPRCLSELHTCLPTGVGRSKSGGSAPDSADIVLVVAPMADMSRDCFGVEWKQSADA